MTEWFRTPAWDPAAREDFERRLGRSRGQHSEYLRIKAGALEEAGLLDEAVALYERYLAIEDAFDRAHVHERLAEVSRRRGDLEDAVSRYRHVLTYEPHLMTSGMVEVKLAEVLLELGRADEAAEALSAARSTATDAFHANAFRHAVVSARLAEARGDREEAALHARAALDLLDAPEGYPYHPGIDVVATDEATLALLRDLADPER